VSKRRQLSTWQRSTRQRSIRIEQLEQRALLAAAVLAPLIESTRDGAEGEGEPLVRFSYEFVSAADQSLDPNPSDNIIEYRAAMGDVVKLRVYAEDLRDTPQGILSAYHDIAFTHQESNNEEILGLLFGEANVLSVELPSGAGSYSGGYQIQYEALSGNDTTIGLSHPLTDGTLSDSDAATLAAAIRQLNWNAWVSPDFPITTRLLPNTAIDGKSYARFAIEFTGSALRRQNQPDASLASNTLQFGAGNTLAANIEVVQPNPLEPQSVSVATLFPESSGNTWGENRKSTWHQVANGYELRRSGGELKGSTVSSPAERKLLYEVAFEVLKIGSLELSGALSDVLTAPISLIGNAVPLTAAEVEFPQAVLFHAVEPGSDYLERNNTQVTASNLGTIEGAFTLPGLSIHNSGDEDWIRFSTVAVANHSHYAAISFNHLAGDLDFELYNQAGQKLAISETSNSQEYVSLQGLAAGTYYARVIGYQGSSNLDYELRVNLPIVNIGGDGLEANDTVSSATNLGVVTAAGQLTGLSIHSPTDTDYFRFEIASQGKANQYVQVDFVHASGDLELRLYNAGGVLLETAATSNDFERISLAGRNAGVYYIQVRGENNARNPLYNLIIQPPTSSIDPDAFEPNDQRATATNFAVTQPFYEFDQLSIHQAGNEDWYSFYLSKSGAAGHYVSANFEHSLGDVDLQLLDRNGLLVRSSTLAANEERISLAGLPIGDYFIRVYGNSNARQQYYKLGLSVPVVEVDADFYEPANNRLSAYELRTVAGSFSLDYLTIHNSTDEDWFRFNTTAQANADHFVGLLYRAGDGDVDLELYDSAGAFLVGSSVNDNWERISFAGRQAGTYYLRIRSTAGRVNSQYSLGFSLPQGVVAQDRFEANEVRATASDLKTITGVYALSGLSIHAASDNDWYRFSLVGDGMQSNYIELQSSALAGDINLGLYDVAGNLLQESVGAADAERLSLFGYAAGEYYLSVSGQNGATASAYELLFDTPITVIPVDPYESNDFRNTAYDLRALEGGRTMRGGSIHSPTDQDWFRFQLLNISRDEHFVSLKFSHTVGDLDLALFDTNGNLLRSANTTADSERISLNGLLGGTYFVRVSGFAGATQPVYDLEFLAPIGSALVPDRFESNNSLANATVVRNQVSSLQGSFALTDLNIHTASDQDYFRFTIVAAATAAHSITLDYNPSDGDLDLLLYDATGSALRQSTQVSSIDSISLAGLASGTYTVAVKAKSNTPNSYRLAFDTPRPIGEKDDWTIMVYMTSSNQEKQAFADLNELEKAALSLPGTVNLVVYWDQSSSGTKYATGNGTQAAWGTVGQAVLRPDRDATSIATSFELLAEQNSGAASSLSNFISYATTVAPADRYALIAWGQGGGVSGFVRDDGDGTALDRLEISEWIQAMRAPASPQFDVLIVDAALSGIVELAYSARDVADYLVVSPSAMPNAGFDYEVLLAALRDQADLSGSLLAASLVQNYEREYASVTHSWSSLTAIRLAEMLGVAAALKSWVQSTASLNVVQRDAMVDEMFSAIGYWKAEYRDLGQAMRLLASNSLFPQAVRNAAQNVADSLEVAVASRIVNSRDTSGVSLVLPRSTAFAEDYKTRFAEFFAATDWDDFVTGVVDRYEELGTANQRFGRAITQQDWSETNSLAATATNLYQQSGANIIYTDLSLSRADDVDWFRFSIGATATAAHQIRLTKEGASAVKLELYDSKGSTLLRSHTSTTTPTLTLNGLAASSYMLKVSAADAIAVSRYSLAVDAPVATTLLDRTGGNQTANRAHNLGVVIQSVEHVNQTLASVAEEWFTFQSPKLPESTWYSIQVRLSNGITAEAILKNSAGQVVSKASGTSELLLGYKAPTAGETYQLQVISKTAVRGTFHVQIENLQATFADVGAAENLAGMVIGGLPLSELVAAAGTVTLSDPRFQWLNNQLRLSNDAYLSLTTEQSVFVRLTVQDSANVGKSVSVIVPIDIMANANPWHNKKQKYNTNFDIDSLGNEVVNAIDALTIINSLNRVGGAYKLPVFRRAAPSATELQYDVNDDGSVTAIDALIVINYLNSRI
jgi:hypothetical protein